MNAHDVAAAPAVLPRMGAGVLLVPAAIAGGALAVVAGNPSAYEATLVVLFAAVLGCIAAYDAATHRAPNVVTYSAVPLALVLVAPLGAGAFLEAAAGGLLAFALLLAVAVAGRGAMGYGDVKAGVFCGIVAGLGGVLPMLLFAFVAGAVIAALALVSRRRNRKDAIAFTPFLVFGVIAALITQPLYLVQ